MMIPKITFRYSWIYDGHAREYARSQKVKHIVSIATVQRFRERLERAWRPHERDVLHAIARVTGLPWGEREIMIYVRCRGRDFSDPLSIRYHRSLIGGVDVLTHELIHRNVAYTSHQQAMRRARNVLARRHRGESESTRIHILIHAVHAVVFRRCFSEARLRNEIRHMQSFEDYRRAWEIVQEEGAEEILIRFRAMVQG